MRRRFWFDCMLVEIVCADCAGVLNAMMASKIQVWETEHLGALTMRLKIDRKENGKLRDIAEKYGANMKVLRYIGLHPILIKWVRRPVLMAFLVVTFLLFSYVPSRVLFISVEGNRSIPTRYILEVAAECGICFGADRREVRSEIMKNRLLEKIPQLQWAGINTSGCTATISVQEKVLRDNQTLQKNVVSSVVAARDGVIQSCTVLRGDPLCTVGQAVKAGQTLVSGYLNCGMVTKTTQASAEIKALTFRELEVMAVAPLAVKGDVVRVKENYSLRIGKKLIKFYKDSGNLDSSCGKIYSEEYVRLPGGFLLPIAIVKETVQYYTDEQLTASADWDAWLSDFTTAHLKGLLISGEIVSKELALNPIDGACYVYGKFTCVEMIGQTKYEQTVPKDG